MSFTSAWAMTAACFEVLRRTSLIDWRSVSSGCRDHLTLQVTTQPITGTNYRLSYKRIAITMDLSPASHHWTLGNRLCDISFFLKLQIWTLWYRRPFWVIAWLICGLFLVCLPQRLAANSQGLDDVHSAISSIAAIVDVLNPPTSSWQYSELLIAGRFVVARRLHAWVWLVQTCLVL